MRPACPDPPGWRTARPATAYDGLPLPPAMSPADLLQQHAAAVASADLDAVLALYADDAVLASFEWTAEGADAVRQRFADFFEFHGEIASVDLVYQQATADTAFALYEVTGERGAFRIVNAFFLQDGRVARHLSNEVGADLDRDEVEG